METTDNRLLNGILEQAEQTAHKKLEDAKKNKQHVSQRKHSSRQKGR